MKALFVRILVPALLFGGLVYLGLDKLSNVMRNGNLQARVYVALNQR